MMFTLAAHCIQILNNKFLIRMLGEAPGPIAGCEGEAKVIKTIPCECRLLLLMLLLSMGTNAFLNLISAILQMLNGNDHVALRAQSSSMFAFTCNNNNKRRERKKRAWKSGNNRGTCILHICGRATCETDAEAGDDVFRCIFIYCIIA